MGKLIKQWRDERGSIQKCGGQVHGFVKRRGDNEQFGIKISTHAPPDDAFEGYALLLSDDEAEKLKKRLDAFLKQD